MCFVLGSTVSAQKVEPENMHIFNMVASRDYENAKKAINITGVKDIETDFITIRNRPSMQCLSTIFWGPLQSFNQLTAFQFKVRKENHFALYREDFQYGFIDTDGNPVNEKYDVLLQDTKGGIWGTIDGKKKRIKLQGNIPAQFMTYKTR